MEQKSVSNLKLASIAVGTFFMMMCNGVINNTTSYFIAPVTEYLHCSRTSFSVYFTIITICSAIMSIVVGPIAQKLGPRKSALVAMVGSGCGFFLLSRLQNLAMVYIAAVLIGVFQAFVVVPTVGIINKWFDKKAGSVTGVTMSATGFGGLLMGLVMPAVVANFSWRTGYLICLGIWIVLTALVFLLTGGEPPAKEGAQATKAKKASTAKGSEAYTKVVRSPGFILLMISACAISGVSMISQHMSALLTGNGMNVATVSMIMGVMSLALAFAKILEGLLFDRIPDHLFVPAVMLVGTIGYLALTFRSTPMMLLGVLGYGISAAGCTVLYPAILRHVYGKELTGAVWGICWAMFMIGHAIWTPFYAWVFDFTGSYTPALISSAVIFVLLALYMFILLSRTPKADG